MLRLVGRCNLFKEVDGLHNVFVIGHLSRVLLLIRPLTTIGKLCTRHPTMLLQTSLLDFLCRRQLKNAFLDHVGLVILYCMSLAAVIFH